MTTWVYHTRKLNFSQTFHFCFRAETARKGSAVANFRVCPEFGVCPEFVLSLLSSSRISTRSHRNEAFNTALQYPSNSLLGSKKFLRSCGSQTPWTVACWVQRVAQYLACLTPDVSCRWSQQTTFRIFIWFCGFQCAGRAAHPFLPHSISSSSLHLPYLLNLLLIFLTALPSPSCLFPCLPTDYKSPFPPLDAYPPSSRSRVRILSATPRHGILLVSGRSGEGLQDRSSLFLFSHATNPVPYVTMFFSYSPHFFPYAFGPSPREGPKGRSWRAAALARYASPPRVQAPPSPHSQIWVSSVVKCFSLLLVTFQ